MNSEVLEQLADLYRNQVGHMVKRQISKLEDLLSE